MSIYTQLLLGRKDTIIFDPPPPQKKIIDSPQYFQATQIRKTSNI